MKDLLKGLFVFGSGVTAGSALGLVSMIAIMTIADRSEFEAIVHAIKPEVYQDILLGKLHRYADK